MKVQNQKSSNLKVGI